MPTKKRTVHGQQRHREGTRPTAQAFQDKENPGEVYLQRDGRIVHVGTGGRTHIFDAEALLTSFRTTKRMRERKTRDGFWKRLFNRSKGKVMKLNKQKKVADVLLYNVEVSEAELEIYQQCLEYVLAQVDPKRIEEDFGAYPEELAGMLDDLRDILPQLEISNKSTKSSPQLAATPTG